MSKKPEIVFVLGAPGSGKGTQCDRIMSSFGFVHVSVGELIRQERDTPGSPYRSFIEQHTVDGNIMPYALTCSLIEKAMNKSGADKFVIDGYPRTQDNLDGWNKVMADKVELLFVLFFECSQEICTERCLKRGRSDDSPECLAKRFNTEMNITMPIVKHFEDLGLLRTVQAAASPDEVFQHVHKIFEKLSSKQDS